MATTTPEDERTGTRAAKRLKREDPARTHPHRDWMAIPRQPAGGRAARTQSDPGDGPGRFGDAVSHGVKLGYGVVEEQIRQGRRVAEDVSRASYGPAAMGDDLRETTERVWRYYADLGRLWFDFATAFTPGANRARDAFRGMPGTSDPWPGREEARQRGRPMDPASAPSGSGSAISIQVASRRPVRATLDLRPGSEGLELFTPELRASSHDSPPLTEVVFERAPSGCPPTVCIRVPDDHPADTYLGVVVDRRTGQHVGTLSVCVSA